MRKFKVKNFESFQRYKDREPTWIMLHRTLLRDYEFGALPDVTKGHLMLIWLLTSQEKDRLLPFDPIWVGQHIQAREPVNLQILVDIGFLLLEPEVYQNDTVLVPTRDLSLPSVSVSNSASVPKKPEAVYPVEFLEFWAVYPRKDAKQDAAKAHRKLTAGERLLVIADVPRRLHANWAGRDLDKLPQAATYLNQRRWEDELAEANGRASPNGPNLTEGHRNLVESIQRERANGTASGQTDFTEGERYLVPPANGRRGAG